MNHKSDEPRSAPPSPEVAGPKIVNLDDLQRGGTKFVRLVDGPALEGIVARAVGAALRKAGGAAGQGDKVLTAARDEVRRALKQATTETVDGAEKRRKSQLEAATVRLRAEIGHTELRLRLLQGRPLELECRSLAPEAIDDLAAHARAAVKTLIESGEVRTPEGDPFGAAAGMQSVKKRLMEVLDEVLTAERTRLRTEVEASRAERAEVLARRINDLREELKKKQEELTGDGEAPARSPFEVPPPGLDPSDPFLMWRWRLLNWTFMDNLQLQGRVATSAATASTSTSQDEDGPSRDWLWQALTA
jgi:hypothetical protein